MALHNEILENFLMHVRGGFRIDNPEHSLALLKILIKCCDISNEVRSVHSSETWVDRLLDEFFLQVPFMLYVTFLLSTSTKFIFWDRETKKDKKGSLLKRTWTRTRLENPLIS